MNGNISRESTKQKMNLYTLSMIAALLICPLKGAAQGNPQTAPTPVQIVALDECDPTTFNADPKAKGNPGLVPDFGCFKFRIPNRWIDGGHNRSKVQ
jgi:hypothetical protein